MGLNWNMEAQTTGKYPTHAGWWWFWTGNFWRPWEVLWRDGELRTHVKNPVSNTAEWRWGPEIKCPPGSPSRPAAEPYICVCGRFPMLVEVKRTVGSGSYKGESLVCKWRVECSHCGLQTVECMTRHRAIRLWNTDDTYMQGER